MHAAPIQEAYLRAIYTVTIDNTAHSFSFSRDRFPRNPAALPIPQPWAIISARNPMSRQLDEETNRQRDRALATAITLANLTSHRASGASTDNTWREPSQLIAPITRSTALILARRFNQRAIVWSEHATTGILDCRTETWSRRQTAPTRSYPVRIT